MAKKFILLQIVMVTFGIALFFALASLKQRVSDKIGPDDSGAAAIDQAENARGGCNFHDLPGQPVDVRSLRDIPQTAVIVLPDTVDYVPRPEVLPETLSFVQVFIDRKSIVTRVVCD